MAWLMLPTFQKCNTSMTITPFFIRFPFLNVSVFNLLPTLKLSLSILLPDQKLSLSAPFLPLSIVPVWAGEVVRHVATWKHQKLHCLYQRIQNLNRNEMKQARNLEDALEGRQPKLSLTDSPTWVSRDASASKNVGMNYLKFCLSSRVVDLENVCYKPLERPSPMSVQLGILLLGHLISICFVLSFCIIWLQS